MFKSGLRAARLGAATLMLGTLGACSSGGGLGGLGSVLGSVLGGGQQQGSQVSGTVVGLDTRNQQIALRQSNGQTVGIQYDQNTQVVYNNQNYSVGNLENGDQVTLRVQPLQNGGYYTDLVQVDQSVSASRNSSTSSQVQTLYGTVRQVDQNNAQFILDTNNGSRVNVVLPTNVNRTDYNRFQNLRPGDTVRLYGIYLNNNRVELRQFY
jgi:hypothetical protein